MERKSFFDEVHGRKFTVVYDETTNDIRLLDDNEFCVAVIDPDDFYDFDGNRFTDYAP